MFSIQQGNETRQDEQVTHLRAYFAFVLAPQAFRFIRARARTPRGLLLHCRHQLARCDAAQGDKKLAKYIKGRETAKRDIHTYNFETDNAF